MSDSDKSKFFVENGTDSQAVRDAASEVNEKHTGEPTSRKRGRPRKNPEFVKPSTPPSNTSDTVQEAPAYVDPEVVRVGFKAIVRAVDDYFGKKCYHLVEAATRGDTGMAQRFRDEAAVSPELVEAYGEAAVGLVKKYAFLLQYAPEGLMLCCLVADASIKITVFKKIKELCAFVATVNANSPQTDQDRSNG